MNEVLEVARAWNISPSAPIIKWYQTKLTYEDKYRFGHLSVYEYYVWMNELMAKENEDAESESDSVYESNGSSTFWKDDTQERTNVSNDEYASFLSENNIDVSNTTKVDIDSILAEAEDDVFNTMEENSNHEVTEAEINDVLDQVNRDIHGDAILTEEEIAALFAAAGN